MNITSLASRSPEVFVHRSELLDIPNLWFHWTAMSSTMNSMKAKAETLLHGSQPPPSTHRAAVISEQGARFKIENRSTPAPKTNELLLQVKAVALNPVDYAQRDFGFHTSKYPGVLGSDVGGIVVAVGPEVSHFKVGDRVTAFAPAFDTEGLADYGAFQEYVLLPAAYAAKIPDSLSFREAATMPMAVETTMAGWYSIGISKEHSVTAEEKQGLLVWGGSSSVGTAAVQIAKDMGFVVYSTASTKHHDYVKSLGASKVFDYKDTDVVDQIVKAAKDDAIHLKTAYDAAGALQQIIDVLSASSSTGGKIASAIPLKEDGPAARGIDVKFVIAPTDTKERSDWASYVFNKWLETKLADGAFVPSPKIEMIAGGLESINDGLDKLKQGVSGTKLVLDIN